MSDSAAVFRGPDLDLQVQTTFPFHREGDDMVGSVTLRLGETAALVLTTGIGTEPADHRRETGGRARGDHPFWHSWLRGSAFRGGAGRRWCTGPRSLSRC